MKKKSLLLLCIGMFPLFSLSSNTPDALNIVKKETAKEYEILASKVNEMQEKLDKEKNILRSFNQNMLFLTNIVASTNKVATPYYQKSITYGLTLDLKEKELLLDTMFENNTLNTKNNFQIPFICDQSCIFQYEILYLDGNSKQYNLTLERTNVSNKLKIEEKSYEELLTNLENAELLTIRTLTIPFQDDLFNFYLN